MTCKEARSLIPDLIRDPDTCPKRDKLMRHLNNCPACYQEWCSAKETIGKVTDSFDWNKVSPSARLQRDIYRAAKEESARLQEKQEKKGLSKRLKKYVSSLLK